MITDDFNDMFPHESEDEDEWVTCPRCGNEFDEDEALDFDIVYESNYQNPVCRDCYDEYYTIEKGITDSYMESIVEETRERWFDDVSS